MLMIFHILKQSMLSWRHEIIIILFCTIFHLIIYPFFPLQTCVHDYHHCYIVMFICALISVYSTCCMKLKSFPFNYCVQLMPRWNLLSFHSLSGFAISDTNNSFLFTSQKTSRLQLQLAIACTRILKNNLRFYFYARDIKVCIII